MGGKNWKESTVNILIFWYDAQEMQGCVQN